MHLNFKPLAIAMLLVALPVLSFAAAGKAQFVTGDVLALGSDGVARTITKGADFNAGDTIKTQSGRVQLRFTDGGYISLQPNTEFKVDEYAYTQESADSGKNFFTLLKGGMRAITGLVGKNNKQAYRVNTPVATIGIRGTEYLAQYDDKLLVKVGDGAVYITNLGGDIILYKGQVGEVSGESSKPQYSDEEPNVNAAAPQGASPQEVLQQTETENDRLGTFSVSELTNGGEPCVVAGGCQFAALNANQSPAPSYTGLIFGTEYEDGAYPFSLAQVEASYSEITVDASGNLLSGKDLSDSSSFTFSGQTLDKGSIGGAGGFGGFSGGLSWARLAGGEFVITDSVGNVTNEINSNSHVIFGALTEVNDPVFSGPTAYYDLAGGTQPTDAAGNLGALSYANMYVDFVGGTMQLSMGLTMNTGPGAGNYFVDADGILSNNIFGITSSSVSGPGCDGCDMQGVGFFSGSSAIRAGLAYTISGSFASGDISGVAALVKSAGGD